MGNADLHNNIKAVRLISPYALSSDSTVTSQVIDRSGFNSLELVLAWGTMGGANITVTVYDSDTSTANFAAISDSYLLGTEAGIGMAHATDDNTVAKIGVTSSKRYVKVILNTASATGTLAGVAILGNPRVAPQSTQEN